MAIFEFLKFGTYDMTSFLDYQNYEMNSQPVVTMWTDGNQVEHRNVIRNRIVGKAKLEFRSSSDMTTFLSRLAALTQTDGYISVSAYVQNLNAISTFNAFVDTESTAKWDFTNSREYHIMTVTIRER